LDHRWLKTTTPISFACRVTIEIMTFNPPAQETLCLSGEPINGVHLDVRGAAVLFGVTEKTLRARVARDLKQLTTGQLYQEGSVPDHDYRTTNQESSWLDIGAAMETYTRLIVEKHFV